MEIYIPRLYLILEFGIPVLSLYKYACYSSRLSHFFVIDVVLEWDLCRVDSLGINSFGFGGSQARCDIGQC